jgi:hypothetical protein
MGSPAVHLRLSIAAAGTAVAGIVVVTMAITCTHGSGGSAPSVTPSVVASVGASVVATPAAAATKE